jgi:hypothetical protein
MREHIVEERRSPISIILRCSCGWRREITRRQNALARAAKVKAAIHLHEKENDPIGGPLGWSR